MKSRFQEVGSILLILSLIEFDCNKDLLSFSSSQSHRHTFSMCYDIRFFHALENSDVMTSLEFTLETTLVACVKLQSVLAHIYVLI